MLYLFDELIHISYAKQMQIPLSVEDEVRRRDKRCFLTGLEVSDGQSAYNDRMVVSWIYHPTIAHEVRLAHFICEYFD